MPLLTDKIISPFSFEKLRKSRNFITSFSNLSRTIRFFFLELGNVIRSVWGHVVTGWNEMEVSAKEGKVKISKDRISAKDKFFFLELFAKLVGRIKPLGRQRISYIKILLHQKADGVFIILKMVAIWLFQTFKKIDLFFCRCLRPPPNDKRIFKFVC